MNAAGRRALVLTCVPAFVVALDNLVVSTALATIRRDLHASVADLGWVVNAYVLSFGVLMLTAAAAGDRIGRRRTFCSGLVVFSLASASAALAPSTGWLIGARAVQGLGAAIVIPLGLALVCDRCPRDQRGAAIGIWGAVTGAAVAIGPLIGGAIVQGLSWHWIFWINVPIGLGAAALAPRFLTESYGPRRPLDPAGLTLSGLGLFGVVWAIVRGGESGWTSAEVIGPICAGLLLLAAFVVWQARVTAPMIPRALLGSRSVGAANVASFLMAAGLFAAAFVFPQYLQTALGHSPLEAGLRLLPWTGIPLLVTPLAGSFADKVGNRPLIVSGLALQAAGFAWLAATVTAHSSFATLVAPLLLAGAGIGLVFPSVANAVMGGLSVDQLGLASATNACFREIGGVFGVAIAATVFAHRGGLASPQQFADGTAAVAAAAAGLSALGAALGALATSRRSVAIPEPQAASLAETLTGQ